MMIQEKLYLITPNFEKDERVYLDQLKRSLDYGIRLVQFRSKHLFSSDLKLSDRSLYRAEPMGASPASKPTPSGSLSVGERLYMSLAEKVVALCRLYEATVVLNASIEVAHELKASGVHLTSNALMALEERPIDSAYVLSVACHNEEQLRQAEKINADFAALSPVLKTTSSPNGIPMGWGKFQQLAESVSIPVFALGGLGLEDLTVALAHGAVGVAAMRGLWDLEDIP